jgi:hypothetical protein
VIALQPVEKTLPIGNLLFDTPCRGDAEAPRWPPGKSKRLSVQARFRCRRIQQYTSPLSIRGKRQDLAKNLTGGRNNSTAHSDRACGQAASTKCKSLRYRQLSLHGLGIKGLTQDAMPAVAEQAHAIIYGQQATANAVESLENWTRALRRVAFSHKNALERRFFERSPIFLRMGSSR